MRRFKIHNLAFAISLISACIAEQAAYAENPKSTTNSTNSNVTDNRSAATLVNTESALDAPLSFGFYDRKQLAELPKEQQIPVPASCRGVWITPIPLNSDKKTNSSINESSTTTRSDYAYYDPDQGSVMTGNVRISQPNYLMTADKATLDQAQTIATASGNVKIASPGFVSYGGTAVYNLETKTGSIKNSKYIAEDRQAHGSAGEVIRESDHLTRIIDSEYSTCEPDTVGWKLKSHQLILNQETGRGVARDARLYIGKVPIFYTPYFNFPIDDRRASGILIPTLRYSSHNGLDFALPYYLNLAPNYDATLTPRIITSRNPMLDGEFRFLTQNFGSGIIDGSFLPNDPKYNDLDRKEIRFKHDLAFNSHWDSHINLNYVSDKDYFSDVGQTLGPINNLNQERSATLNYNNSTLGLIASLQALNYQGLDKSVPDISRPYGRVQLKLNYDQGSLNGLERFAYNETGYFQREINDGSGPQTNGIRQYNTLGFKYNFREPSGYLIPNASVRTLLYQDQTNNNNRTPTIVVPQFTFDSGLFFERDIGTFLQTLEPRFFYAYSPYVNQDALPVFDTTYTSSNYNQLFNPSRFVGNDRLDDNNFATLGLTSRLYDADGLERLRIGVADRFYFNDRETKLFAADAIGTARSSGIGLDLGATWSKHLSYSGSSLWLASGKFSANSSDVHYTTDIGSVLSLGYIFRRNVTEDHQIGSRQATASFVQPVYNNFRILGSVQYDYQTSAARDALIGVDYDSCCWSVSVYGRSYYNDFEDPRTTRAHTGIVFQVTFKGLASNSESPLTALLKQKIYGFTQVDSSWQKR
ncbi:MAG: LPS-assembly protein LptD [Candidatus Saccharibacteria bacterium]|nr:LPS-assembly protein LptD [Moraxellaceae bacterium]